MRTLPLALVGCFILTLSVSAPVMAQAASDFSDAPASYGIAEVTNPASSVYLGNCVDTEATAFTGPNADGDDLDVGTVAAGSCSVAGDDEDGVTFDTPLDPGQTAQVTVTCVGGFCGVLNVWFDWNADGDFLDAGEQVFTDQVIAAGSTPLSFSVPAGATTGPIFARFFVCDDVPVCNNPNDQAFLGEVEDYMVTVVPVTLQSFTVE